MKEIESSKRKRVVASSEIEGSIRGDEKWGNCGVGFRV